MRKLLILLMLLGAGGCSRIPMLPGLSAHKMDIQQGNYVTQDMVEKLKPGMTRNQVKFALGTPLVTDPFHNDRWDYVYVFQKRGRVVEHRKLVVVFKDDKLERIEGDAIPAGELGGAAGTPAPQGRRK